MTYKGFSPTAFARVSSTTLAKHIRDVEEAMSRNFAMGALLNQNGRILFNEGGVGFDWPVQYRLHNVEGNTGETQRNFARRNLWKVAKLEYRGYQATDTMYLREFLENRGPEGIVKVFDRFVDRLETSLQQHLGKQYYVDGEAAGNEQSWHGFESLFGINGTIDSTKAGAVQRAANAADKFGYPSATYAGLNTQLGAYSGENESGQTWPNGVADPEFDFWSPIVVNYTSTAYGGATTSFKDQGREAMRDGIWHSQRNSSLAGQITNIFLARDLYIDLLNDLDTTERTLVTSENSLRAYGFKNVVVFDGLEVALETGINTGIGYGMNWRCVDLRSMNDRLLVSEGPEYDIHSQSFNTVVYTLSNLRFATPRDFFKVMAIA